MTAQKPIVSLRKPAPLPNLSEAERFVHAPEPALAPAADSSVEAAAPEAAAPLPAANVNEPPRERASKPKASAVVSPPASKRKVQHRKDGRALRATTVYFPVDVAKKLNLHCADREVAMSDFITELVVAALEAQRGQ